MERKITAVLAVFVLLVVGGSLAGGVQAQSEAWAAVMARANQLYEAGRYKEAAAHYEEIVASGLQNGQVAYNLGNAYFQQGRLGLAVLNYERARRLLPRDEDVRANLAFVRSQLVDQIETPDPGGVGRWLSDLQGLLTLDETILVAWGLYLVMGGLTLLAVYVWRWRRLCLYALGGLGLVLLLVVLSLGIKAYQQEHLREAVIVVEQVDVLSGPGDQYAVEFTLHEGTTVALEETRGEWQRLRLGGDLEGWARDAGLQEIGWPGPPSPP